jgi:hypothetical protein
VIVFALDVYRAARRGSTGPKKWRYVLALVCTRDDAMAMLAAMPRTENLPKWRAVAIRDAKPSEKRSVPEWMDAKIQNR